MKIMFGSLKEYDLKDIGRALMDFAKTCKLSVNAKPSDVIERLGGSRQDRSAVAWRLFLRAVGRYGYYDSVRFPDPAFHFVIQQMGGWLSVSRKFMTLSESEVDRREKSWRELYEIGMREATWERVPQTLAGFYEIDNSGKGLSSHSPLPIDIMSNKPISRQSLQALPGISSAQSKDVIASKIGA